MARPTDDLARASLRENVYASVKRGILEGELRPGGGLSEIGIARTYHTSRSPVRDAFARLELEGYVIRKPSGRVIVAPLDTEELWNLYQVRANVEGLAARLATPQLTGHALDQLATHLEHMAAFSVRGDLNASLDAGGCFHEVIARHCGNPPLREMIDTIRGRIKRYQHVIAGARQKNLRIREHKAILVALKKRDATAAEIAMRDHVLRSAEAIMQTYAASPAITAP